jgi:hypothetical protein
MWEISGKTCKIERFPSFEPVEILYEFDGPRVFTIRDDDGQLNVAYWSDEDDRVTRYVIAPTHLTNRDVGC